jgi:hypothetical protein
MCIRVKERGRMVCPSWNITRGWDAPRKKKKKTKNQSNKEKPKANAI